MSTQDTTNTYAIALSHKIKEKYHFLLIGFTVVVIAILAFMNVLTSSGTPLWEVLKGSSTEQATQQSETPAPKVENIYRVQKGDHLWNIAQAKLGTGYKAYDIAKLNNLVAPYILVEGQEIVLPTAQPIAESDKTTTDTTVSTTGDLASGVTAQVTDTSTTHTIATSESLWTIAQKAYGDGNMWTKIASANNLTNPSVIHVGNTLQIPR